MRFAFNLNLSNAGSDGLNGARYREECDQREARVRQTRVNTLADRPDATLSGQCRDGIDRIVGHNVVELPHQSLIGPENDCAYRTRMSWCFGFLHPGGRRPVFPNARAQTQLDGPIIVGQRAHRFLVLSDTRCGQCFHRADYGLQIGGTADLSAQALRGLAHDLSLASGLGWKGVSAWRAIAMIVLRSSSLNLSALSNRPHTSAGMFARSEERRVGKE